jgi:Rrf2 family transcriptional regulator, iron-sulfur cluster assembly transcription factor
MFKISRKTEYAVRGLIHLARQPGDKFILLREIGKATRTSPVFLAKIFQVLNNAGLVESSRGAVGGFRLAKRPERISLKEVLEAVEGPVQVNECVVDGRSCDFSRKCSAHAAWKKVRKVIDSTLKDITLKEIARKR